MPTNESGPCVCRISDITAKEPEPESGRSSAIGSASAGKPTADVTGSSARTIRSSRPEARNIPTATRIATM